MYSQAICLSHVSLEKNFRASSKENEVQKTIQFLGIKGDDVMMAKEPKNNEMVKQIEKEETKEEEDLSERYVTRV